jgi:hypothetical protein
MLFLVLFLSFIHYTHPSKLPKETTLYQAIYSSTTMIGAIKIIHPLEYPTDQNTNESLLIEDC